MKIYEMRIGVFGYVAAESEKDAQSFSSELITEELAEIHVREVGSMADVQWDREAIPYGRSEGKTLGEFLIGELRMEVPLNEMQEIRKLIEARGGRVVGQ